MVSGWNITDEPGAGIGAPGSMLNQTDPADLIEGAVNNGTAQEPTSGKPRLSRLCPRASEELQRKFGLSAAEKITNPFGVVELF